MIEYTTVISQLALLFTLAVFMIGAATIIGISLIVWAIGKYIDISWVLIELVKSELARLKKARYARY